MLITEGKEINVEREREMILVDMNLREDLDENMTVSVLNKS